MQDRLPTQKDLNTQSLGTASEASDHLSYREILRFLKRYALVIGGTTALAAVLAGLYSILATPVYTAHAQILIESRLPQGLRQQLGEATLALDSPQIESQIAVLRSEQVAHGVVTRLKLGEDSEFAPPAARRSLLAFLTGQPAAVVDEAKRKQSESITIQSFQNNLDIRRYGLSYVLDINFSSKNPEKAAIIANAVADAYLADQLNVKVAAARQASDWREDQVNRLRERMNKAARAVQEFKAKRDYRLSPSREIPHDGTDPAAPRDAATPVDRRDGNTMEELEVTSLAYRKIYETNLQSHIEALQRQALQFTDARVITAAAVPLDASFPRNRLVILFGLSMGALLGLAGALILNAFDQTITTPAELEDGQGLLCLGVIPPSAFPDHRPATFRIPQIPVRRTVSSGNLEDQLLRAKYRQALDAPGTRFGQGLRTVRTTVNRIRKSEDMRIIGIGALSEQMAAGVVATNLGGLLVATSVRTLVIDLDGRERGLSPSDSQTAGVAEALLGQITLEAVVNKGPQGSADFIPAGLAANRHLITDLSQAEALTSLLSGISKSYDLILVALPAFTGNGDTISFAAHTDGIILLVESGVTPSPRLTAVVSGLRTAGSRVIGAILASDEDVMA